MVNFTNRQIYVSGHTACMCVNGPVCFTVSVKNIHVYVILIRTSSYVLPCLQEQDTGTHIEDIITKLMICSSH